MTKKGELFRHVYDAILRGRYCSPDVAEFFLDLPDGLEIGRAVEGVAAHKQKFDQIPRDVAPGDVEPPREMRERKAVVHGHDVRHAVARVDHDARRQACVPALPRRSASANQNQKTTMTTTSHDTHLVRRA